MFAGFEMHMSQDLVHKSRAPRFRSSPPKGLLADEEDGFFLT